MESVKEYRQRKIKQMKHKSFCFFPFFGFWLQANFTWLQMLENTKARELFLWSAVECVCVCCCCGCGCHCLVAKLKRVWLCYRKDYSPPSSSVHGISQARTLEWIAISFSKGSSLSRDRTQVFRIGRGRLYHWTTWAAHVCVCH